MWEALYLGCIPVVPDCSFFRSFNELPMIYVNDWKTITPKFLVEERNRLKHSKFNYEKLTLTYWRTQIKENKI